MTASRCSRGRVRLRGIRARGGVSGGGTVRGGPPLRGPGVLSFLRRAGGGGAVYKADGSVAARSLGATTLESRRGAMFKKSRHPDPFAHLLDTGAAQGAAQSTTSREDVDEEQEYVSPFRDQEAIAAAARRRMARYPTTSASSAYATAKPEELGYRHLQEGDRRAKDIQFPTYLQENERRQWVDLKELEAKEAHLEYLRDSQKIYEEATLTASTPALAGGETGNEPQNESSTESPALAGGEGGEVTKETSKDEPEVTETPALAGVEAAQTEVPAQEIEDPEVIETPQEVEAAQTETPAQETETATQEVEAAQIETPEVEEPAQIETPEIETPVPEIEAVTPEVEAVTTEAETPVEVPAQTETPEVETPVEESAEIETPTQEVEAEISEDQPARTSKVNADSSTLPDPRTVPMVAIPLAVNRPFYKKFFKSTPTPVPNPVASPENPEEVVKTSDGCYLTKAVFDKIRLQEKDHKQWLTTFAADEKEKYDDKRANSNRKINSLRDEIKQLKEQMDQLRKENDAKIDVKENELTRKLLGLVQIHVKDKNKIFKETELIKKQKLSEKDSVVDKQTEVQKEIDDLNEQKGKVQAEYIQWSNNLADLSAHIDAKVAKLADIDMKQTKTATEIEKLENEKQSLLQEAELHDAKHAENSKVIEGAQNKTYLPKINEIDGKISILLTQLTSVKQQCANERTELSAITKKLEEERIAHEEKLKLEAEERKRKEEDLLGKQRQELEEKAQEARLKHEEEMKKLRDEYTDLETKFKKEQQEKKEALAFAHDQRNATRDNSLFEYGTEEEIVSV